MTGCVTREQRSIMSNDRIWRNVIIFFMSGDKKRIFRPIMTPKPPVLYRTKMCNGGDDHLIRYWYRSIGGAVSIFCLTENVAIVATARHDNACCPRLSPVWAISDTDGPPVCGDHPSCRADFALARHRIRCRHYGRASCGWTTYTSYHTDHIFTSRAQLTVDDTICYKLLPNWEIIQVCLCRRITEIILEHKSMITIVWCCV